eukprot:CAMPEP_0174716150 /NCGR_PEP_ID=MMETSP1094-20130205/23033_1 /TAXON_ID=156173 /ORGANISM="Chrysochromulina brevifilum, Strain UTEX LB 985" /LENGTH=49 /DNA_ID=CAMNT_0015915835 /DNA_START=42 /DNA_END=191 /DNA_ORIENTATION=-
MNVNVRVRVKVKVEVKVKLKMEVIMKQVDLRFQDECHGVREGGGDDGAN